MGQSREDVPSMTNVILFGLEIHHFSDISGRPVNRTMSTVYCAIVIELKNRQKR